MITNVVSALESATSLQVFPFYTEELKECIVYEWTPQSDDGAKQTAQLLVRIKSKSMATLEAKAVLVKRALIGLGDERRLKAYIKQNGGGILKNADTGYIYYIMYFDFTYRSDI